MLNWEEIVQKYIIKHSNQIRKATEPLREHFGVEYFSYHRIDKKGKYTVLVDQPIWAEHYVSEKFFLNDPYLRHPSVYQSGTCLIESHGSEEYKQMIIQSGKKVFKLDMGVVSIQKNENSVEFFSFSGKREKSALEKLYLNHSGILSSFGAHFKKKLQPILIQMEEEAGFLMDLKGEDYICSQPICPDIASATLLAYYKDLGLKYDVERLSSRERQCMGFLAEDLSAKETAFALGLSTRTIEFYFENIKNKLGCTSKQELLKIARFLKEFLP